MIEALKQMEAGRSGEDVGRQHGVSKHTIYVWKSKYDGLGQRVRESFTDGTVRLFVNDIFGNLAAEYTTAAVAASPCQTCYVSGDLLGSTRLVTDEKGNVVGRHDYLPYGEEIVLGRGSQWGPNTDTVRQKFTGQERDTETGVDYFQARYYGSTLQRFTSVDPANAGADAENPQSWNGYGYVGNNPTVNVDPSGMSVWDSLTSFWLGLTGGGSFGGGFCESFSGGENCGSSGGGGGNWGYQESFPFYDTSPFPAGGGGGGGGGGGSSHPKQQVATRSLSISNVVNGAKNLVKQGACFAANVSGLTSLAGMTNAGTAGIGIGGGAAIGLYTGLNVEASVLAVGDQRGNVGVAFTFGGNPGLPVVWGAGANYGGQAMRSNSATIYGLSGAGADSGVAAGDGIAGGVNVGISSDGRIWTATGTVGPGIGLKYGGGSNITYTTLPISFSCNP